MKQILLVSADSGWWRSACLQEALAAFEANKDIVRSVYEDVVFE